MGKVGWQKHNLAHISSLHMHMFMKKGEKVGEGF